MFRENGITMLKYKSGDILTEDAEALVNTVNCVGVMGRSIALQFKNAFPENFDAYDKACKRKEVLPSQVLVFETGQLTNPRYIINFPTKRLLARKESHGGYRLRPRRPPTGYPRKKDPNQSPSHLWAAAWAGLIGMTSVRRSRRFFTVSMTCMPLFSNRTAHRNPIG